MTKGYIIVNPDSTVSDTILLIVKPFANHIFTGWSGDTLLTHGDSARVVMDGSKAVSVICQPALIRSFGSGGYVVFSPDGSKILTGKSNVATLYDVATGNVLKTCNASLEYFESIVFSPDGSEFLTAGSSLNNSLSKYYMQLWETASGTLINKYTSSVNDIWSGISVSFNPVNSKSILVVDFDSAASIINKETGAVINNYPDVSCASFSEGGLELLTGTYDNNKVKLIEISTGKVIQTFTAHTQKVTFVSILPEDKIITVAKDSIRIWDKNAGTIIKALGYDDSDDVFEAVSSDGKKIAVSNSTKLSIRDVSNGQILRSYTLNNNSSYITSAAFSPDGSKIIVGTGFGGSQLWDAR